MGERADRDVDRDARRSAERAGSPAGEDDGVRAPFAKVAEVVTGDPTMSLGEVADQAGLPTRILEELFDAMDWADRPAYDERDVAYASDLATMLDLFPMNAITRQIRSRYRAMTSIVVSDLGIVRDEVVRPALAGGMEPTELAERLGDTAEMMMPLTTGHLDEDYRHVLLRLLDSDAVARGVDLEGGEELELAVGFVDVAGYTALSGRIDPGSLDHVLASFEDMATEAAARAEGVLLVKFLGDAAMFVASDAARLAETLLGMVENEERLAEAPRRAGLAGGPVLVRQGDYFGEPVNLAARLTDHARAWSLLVAEELDGRLGDGFDLTPIPKVRLHGLGERRPRRARRGDGSDDPGS